MSEEVDFRIMSFVMCKICGKPLRIINWSHLRIHNLKRTQYISLYPNAKLISDETRFKSNWSKGLTKETDTRIANRSIAISKALKGKSTWRRGLTKENDERIAKHVALLSGKKRPDWVRKKISKGTSKRYKNINERIKTSFALKEAYKNPLLRKRISDRNSKMKHHSGGNESIGHSFSKELIKEMLIDFGYNVELEKFVTINRNRYAIDVYAQKANEKILVEVGTCSHKKLRELRTHYSNVFQVPKFNYNDLNFLRQTHLIYHNSFIMINNLHNLGVPYNAKK